LGTNEKRTQPTNGDGLYQFVNVTPGQYSVEVQKPGFKRILRSPITVETQSTSKIDIPLQVGDVSQTVEVTAQTPLLQPESSSLGQVVDERKTTELPLNGRNPLNLVALVPSVVPQGGSMSAPNGQNPFAWGNYQIGGGMANQSMTWLDGSPVNGGYLNITALIPTQDALQEFKVATSNLSPEYGRFAGGVVNFTTKSGTNIVHGSAWEFLRNKELNANTFFNNKSGVPRPAFTQNQFGVNLGGPVMIPKLYNGRDKTFFFFDYEGFRLRQGQSSTQTVPTVAERNGDLSAYAAAVGTGIYDPLTTCGTDPSKPCAPGAATGTRQPFAGNKIPSSRINATSLKYLNTYFPMPNTPGDAKGIGNWVGNGSAGGGNNETVVHIDQNVSEKQHITARYTYWGDLNLPTDPFQNGICQDRCTETFNTNNFVLGDTYSFSPSTIMEVRLSYQRFSYDRTPSTLGYDLGQLGPGWAPLNSQVLFRDVPVMVINGFDTANTFNSQGAGSVILSRNDNYRAAGTLTHIAGKHTIKFGAEFLRILHNYTQTNVPTGTFTFNPDLTAANAISTAGSGAGLATYLLGYPSTGNISTPALVAGQQLYPAIFINDDWHITPKLTLNIGLRWEHSGPWTERFDRLSYFDPTRPNAVLAAKGMNVLQHRVGEFRGQQLSQQHLSRLGPTRSASRVRLPDHSKNGLPRRIWNFLAAQRCGLGLQSQQRSIEHLVDAHNPNRLPRHSCCEHQQSIPERSRAASRPQPGLSADPARPESHFLAACKSIRVCTAMECGHPAAVWRRLPGRGCLRRRQGHAFAVDLAKRHFARSIIVAGHATYPECSQPVLRRGYSSGIDPAAADRIARPIASPLSPVHRHWVCRSRSRKFNI